MFYEFISLFSSLFTPTYRPSPVMPDSSALVPSQSPSLQHKNGHLFVLVHGLWGSSSNLNVTEKILQDCVKDLPNNESIYTLKPSTFGYFKTYDGVKSLGDRVINEILFEIERLKLEENVKITKFSIVGYSLGGLISRYCLGELLEYGFFDEIEPCIFTTFATPHLGVRFFNTERCWDRFLNFLGSHLLGQSGRDMFIHKSDILPKLADKNGKYYEALQRFKKRILLANVKYDRTVAFYTSYITSFSPFDNWDAVNVKFIENLPLAKVDGKPYSPKIIDFTNTNLDSSKSPKFNFRNYSTRRSLILSLFVLLGPFLFPLLLSASLIGTVLSNIRNSYKPDVDGQTLWLNVSKILSGESNSFESDYQPTQSDQLYNPLAAVTEEIIEDGVYSAGDIKSNLSDSSSSANATSPGLKVKVEYCASGVDKNKLIESFIEKVDVGELNKNLKLTSDLKELPFDSQRLEMVENLNQLEWIKVACFLSSLNAHESIVARRGLNRTSCAAPVLYLWASLINNELLSDIKKD